MKKMLLKDLIDRFKGGKAVYKIAETSGISASTFYTQLKNEVDVKVGGMDIYLLARGLGISIQEILFVIFEKELSSDNENNSLDLMKMNSELRQKIEELEEDLAKSNQEVENSRQKMEKKNDESSEIMRKYIAILENIAQKQ
jgi:hypothetical protein